MKRESGENPEQTRCCKLRLRVEHYSLPLIGFIFRLRRYQMIGKAFKPREQVRRPATISSSCIAFGE